MSEEPNGPRFRPMPIKEVDMYANLFLLCPSDHKVVDEQVTYYTEQHLQALKHEREQWIKYRFSPTTPPIKARDPEAGNPLAHQRIDTGKALMSVLAHQYTTHHSSPEPRSIEEAELMGAYLQSVVDYIDTWDNIGPSGHIQAEFSMSEDIARLRKAGLVVYATAKKHIVEGGAEPPAPWPGAYIVIRRNGDSAAKASTTNELAYGHITLSLMPSLISYEEVMPSLGSIVW